MPGHLHCFERVVFKRVSVLIRSPISYVCKENAFVVVRNKFTLLHVYFVDIVKFAAYPLVRKYSVLPLTQLSQMDVVRNVLERRFSDAFAYLLVCDLRLYVTDDNVSNLNIVHFGLEFNI